MKSRFIATNVSILFLHAQLAWGQVQPTAAARRDSLLVLDASRAAGLDTERLRAAVADETRREVVLTGDPRAPPSAARVVVTLEAGRTRVRHEPERVERDAPSENGADAQIRQIALLVGNLTRTEAEEILADLARNTGARPTPGPAQASPSPPTEATRDAEAYQRLESTLRYHVDAEAGSLLAGGITESIFAGVSIPTALFIRNRLDEELAGELLLGIGIGAGLAGLSDIASSFSKDVALSDLHGKLVAQHGTRPPGVLVEDTERAWASKARVARSVRRWMAGISVGVGILGLSTGVGLAATASPGSRLDEGRGGGAAILIGLSGFLLATGAHGWLTPSPDEKYYEGYIRASGRLAVSAGVTPLPGGAAFSLTGRF